MKSVFVVLTWTVAVACVVTLWGCSDTMVEVYYTETETETDTENDVEIETETEAEAEVDVETDTDVEVETETEVDVETDVDEREPVPAPMPEEEPEAAPEPVDICDCEDNDNDGEVDEGCEDLFLSFPTPVTCDCSGGLFPCMNVDGDGDVNVFWARQAEECPDGYVPRCPSEPEAEPTAEICDGADNDGDGLVDEVNGVGMCVVMNGAVPTEGEWACVPNPSFDGLLQVGCVEACRWRESIGNYVDNDCDGEVDEAEETEPEPEDDPGTITCEDADDEGRFDRPTICTTIINRVLTQGEYVCDHDSVGTRMVCWPSCQFDEVVGDGMDNDCDAMVDETY
jgi:hypothetical protein